MSAETVCVIGSTHLACVYAAGLAELGVNVVQCDDNPEIIRQLENADPPLFEPGLADLIRRHQPAGRLNFRTDIAQAVSQATIIYLAEDIRVENGLPDISGIRRRFETIVKHLPAGSILAVSTQVPVGTLRDFAGEFGPQSVDGRLRLVYHPEFLRLGAAMKLFLAPDYIVLGHNDETAARRVMDLFGAIDCPKHFMGLADAEMVKHAANAYVAVSVSFACELARFADAIEVDAFKVGKALRSDKRIGSSAYVLPGLGFTGGNLERDITVWQQKATLAHVPTALLNATLAVNDAQAQVPLQLLSNMLGNLKGRKVAIWGLAYKPDSNSIRGSYAIVLVQGLRKAGALVHGFDPNVFQKDLAGAADIALGDDLYAICDGADALAIMNNAKLYSDCDFGRLSKVMRGKNIFDPHGMLDAERATAAGFTYSSIGRGYTLKKPN